MDKRSHWRRPVMAAVVFGAALASLAPVPVHAARGEQPSPRIIAGLGRYCSACWRNARVPVDLWADCTQDVYQRLLERVPASAWEQALTDETEERREFLRAIDTVKKRVRRAKKLANDVETAADPSGVNDWRLREDRELVHRAAAELLSPRQHQILRQSFDGWSVNDIATELKLPPARVSDEKYKAVHKLRAVLSEGEELASRADSVAGGASGSM